MDVNHSLRKSAGFYIFENLHLGTAILLKVTSMKRFSLPVCKETICMKYQILLSGKNKKNIINLPSAENAQRVVKAKGFERLYLLNLWMEVVHTCPDVRYWSEVLCCTIPSYMSGLFLS